VIDPTLVMGAESSRPDPRHAAEAEAPPPRMDAPQSVRGPGASAPLPAASVEEIAAPRPERPSRWGRVVWLFVAMVAGFLLYDTGRALVDIWSRDWIGAAVLTALAVAFVAALISATLIELRAVRRLGEVARFREALNRSLEHDSGARLRRTLEPTLALIRARRPELVKAFGQRSQGLTECDAILKQFRGAVLTPLDQEARRVVRANALTVMGATAVAPHPALDVVIVLWRSTVMVRRVAEVYGLRPSGLSTLVLTKQVVVNAAIAVAADPTGDLVANTLGGGLAEKISARFAEGSISGLRAMRLGARAIETCRPLPFEPDERKGMWHTLTQG
jgi:putative membrane protein